MKILFIKQVHRSEKGSSGHSFLKRVKNVIDVVFYSKKAHECFEWFVENQDVIAGLTSTLWDAVRTLL